MIIERMRATFGKLDDRELTLQPGLNVVTGDNETGKSTWLAFLLAMLYGVDTRERSGRNRLPDKQKFLPWSGKPMAGSMELRADDGRRVTLERSSETGPLADFQAWDTDSGSPREDLTGRSCGRQLLGVEAAVYVRSGYLRQQRIAVSADPRLEKRLSGLVSGGSEDYSYSEADEALKKLQTALRHNQSGALPKAEAAREALREKLARAEEHQGRLAKLEAELHELNRQRNEAREALACLDALERRERDQKLRELEAQLAAAREDREGWQAVCDGQPPEAELLELESQLQQLQSELQKAALEEGLAVGELELPPPDPIFGRMDARQAHDKAAADATLVREALAEEPPLWKQKSLWLILMVAGLALSLTGALLPLLIPGVVGAVVALVGLAGWLRLRIGWLGEENDYLARQDEAREILDQYGAEDAKGVVLRGIRYINQLDEHENAPDGGVSRRRLEELADRRAGIFARLDALIPGCGSPEKAAALFQETAKSRQALAQAKLLEEQRLQQLTELRAALGPAAAEPPAPERYADRDRETETQRLRELDARLEALSSQADQLKGALGQMGDPLALHGELETLNGDIRRMETRYSALHLARQALREADEKLRARFAPLLCEKAGVLLAQLTEGRYDGLRLDRDMNVTVHPADSPVYRSLSYLSGGAVDQLYLALRLALCELLLPNAPIILDDALVYFDDTRASLALKTLRELGKTRQILIFSCQSREKRLLDELANHRSDAADRQAAAARE